MDIKTFQAVATRLPADVSVLIRGPHGIGKSQLVAKVAKLREQSLIDRRLSQMSEGDLVGLPELVDGVTRFCPPDWYAQACRNPVVLLLDEINRATPELQQGAFQIVLARELNGHKLHPGTLVFAAVNDSAEYQVNEMDPALLDRFWVVDLDPTNEDWLAWAADEGDIDPVVIDFIRHYPAHLRFKGQVEPGKLYPSPRSYARLDQTLKFASMAPSEVAGGDSPDGLYALAHGFLGTEAAIAFRDFVVNYELQVSAEDVLDKWEKNRKRILKLNNDKGNGLAAKVVEHCRTNDWTVEQCANLSEWATGLPGEMMVTLWNGVMDTKQVQNITKLHKFMGQAVVEAVQSARNVS